jgi:hypothetical protein
VRELGIGFVAYSAPGRGSGQLKSFDDLPADDVRRRHPRFQGENFQKNQDLVRKIEQLAAAKGCTPSQLALAWVLAQGNDIVPIPGTKRIKYIDDNADPGSSAPTTTESRSFWPGCSIRSAPMGNRGLLPHLFAYLLENLKASREGEGTLPDQCMIAVKSTFASKQVLTGPGTIFSSLLEQVAFARHVLDVWHPREQNRDYISKILALGGIPFGKGHLRKLLWLHGPLAFRKKFFQERP